LPFFIRFCVVLLTVASCTSDHHVSPFPAVDPAELFRPHLDLDGQLARADREARAGRLRLALRVEGKLPGGAAFVALGYEGEDALGQRVGATRVVTPASIVLALGPPRIARDASSLPSTLLASLGPAGAYPSGSDLDGDGAPDVALRADDGTLAVHRIDLQGSSPYPIELRAPPSAAVDVNEDGKPDLTGAPRPPEGDPIAPEMLDVAIAAPGGFRNDHPAARVFHQRRRDRPAPPASAPLARRLRHGLERAFHAAAAGDPVLEALQPVVDLAATQHPLPEDLVASWVRWRGWVIDHGPGLPYREAPPDPAPER
jgi:hypothetical protein